MCFHLAPWSQDLLFFPLCTSDQLTYKFLRSLLSPPPISFYKYLDCSCVLHTCIYRVSGDSNPAHDPCTACGFYTEPSSQFLYLFSLKNKKKYWLDMLIVWVLGNGEEKKQANHGGSPDVFRKIWFCQVFWE